MRASISLHWIGAAGSVYRNGGPWRLLPASELRRYGHVMSILRYAVLLVAASFLSGCSSTQARALRTAEKNPVALEAASGGDFLLSLREQSKLPGMPKDAHGDIRFDFSFPLPERVTYPFSPTFQVSIKGQTLINHYTVLRETKDSPWQLEKAWCTDSQGRIVEELPVR